MKSLFVRHHIHKVLLYRQGGRECICTTSLISTSKQLACTEREHPCPSWHLKSCREDEDCLEFGDLKIEEESFHPNPNSNSVEASGLTAGLAGKRWASLQLFAWSPPKRSVGFMIKGKTLSPKVDIQWISAASLLQKATVLNNQVPHPKAHFLWSLSLAGLMGSDFSCTSINSPRFGSQQKLRLPLNSLGLIVGSAWLFSSRCGCQERKTWVQTMF